MWFSCNPGWFFWNVFCAKPFGHGAITKSEVLFFHLTSLTNLFPKPLNLKHFWAAQWVSSVLIQLIRLKIIRLTWQNTDEKYDFVLIAHTQKKSTHILGIVSSHQHKLIKKSSLGWYKWENMVTTFFSFTCVLPALSSVSSLYLSLFFSWAPEAAANVLVTHVSCQH